uniref:Protein LTV1 homolog n=1 Tax=Romanomermis culicivorax TaxID=13658 RepID=A0A915HX83_ROMCU
MIIKHWTTVVCKQTDIYVLFASESSNHDTLCFMLPKRVRPFIDKKKSVTFHLVHRSQRDPLIAAEGNQLVLTPVDGISNLSINEQPTSSSSNNLLVNGVDEKTMQERIKYGIFFDDDYDYLRHLRDANEVYSLEEQTKEPLEQRYRINKDGTMINAGKDILPQLAHRIVL